MYRQANQEIAAIFVSLKLGPRRSVGRHHFEYLGDPCGTALREIQLFQELADTAIAIAAAHGTPRVVTVMADDDVSAPEVLEVVGEGADCADDDEVQRMPELYEVLRPLADRRSRPASFLLLGSAPTHRG